VVKAGFLRRFAALALDWLTLSIIADIVRFAYMVGSGTDLGMAHLDVAMGLSAALFIIYFTLMTGEGGQTLGKMLLGIKVQAYWIHRFLLLHDLPGFPLGPVG
jgi:uncharacterized RDD family membrane protein YckC